MNLIEEIKKLSDPEFKSFHFKLVPTLDKDKIIGVRIPKLRSLAKEYFKNEDYKAFLNRLPHTYYEENMIHALLLNEMKDYEECIKYLDTFLPYIDNWAVCDSLMNIKLIRKHRELFHNLIIKYKNSNKEFEARFVLILLFSHYMIEEYLDEIFDIAEAISVNDYYAKMGLAWLLSECFIKFRDYTLTRFTNLKIDNFSYNKAISKICDSYRVSKKEKEILKKLRK